MNVKQRRLKLVEVAEVLIPQALAENEKAVFDMMNFIRRENRTTLDSDRIDDLCGTTACLAGWYILLVKDPTFKLVKGFPVYTGDDGGDDLGRYFDLPDYITTHIFYDLHAPLETVINRLHNTFDEEGNLR